jgi:hypothetical protein
VAKIASKRHKKWKNWKYCAGECRRNLQKITRRADYRFSLVTADRRRLQASCAPPRSSSCSVLSSVEAAVCASLARTDVIEPLSPSAARRMVSTSPALIAVWITSSSFRLRVRASSSTVGFAAATMGIFTPATFSIARIAVVASMDPCLIFDCSRINMYLVTLI